MSSWRKAPSSSQPDRRSWAGIWGALFACAWGGNQFSPLLVMYEQRQHLPDTLVSALFGVYVLGLAPALLIAGSMSDRYGRRPLMLMGVITATLGSGLLAVGSQLPELLAAGRLCSGITVGIATSVGSAWIKELSQAPFDPTTSAGSGARRASLAFLVGSASGALVAGLLAQWGPAPTVLPFLIHIAVALPFVAVVMRTPETSSPGGPEGTWWRQLRVPAAAHRRFTTVVAVAAPSIFLAAGVGYGTVPTQLRATTNSSGLLFATAATVLALGISSAIQPLARRLYSPTSARGLLTALPCVVAGVVLAAWAIAQQSPIVGLIANVFCGAGMGIALVCGLLEVQRIADARDLAGLTGVFYAIAYSGFLTPTVISVVAAASGLPVPVILLAIVAMGVACWLLLLVSSRRHLPERLPASSARPVSPLSDSSSPNLG